MIGIAIANSAGLSSNAVGYDPAATAYFAATGINGNTQQQSINNLIKGLKDDGIWSKMKALYPFVTDNRNFCEYTENFNSWLLFQYSSIANNSTTAPNGTLTADTLISGATLGRQETYRTPAQTYTNGVQYTMSVYAKSNGKTWMYLGTNINEAVFFNLQNGTVGSATSLWSGKIESVGNGWYRCTATFTFGSLASAQQIVIGNASANGVYSDTGNNVLGVYLWGAQVELGATATTYQPIATTQQAYIANQFKYNLVNPVDSDAAFRLVFNGGWTHSSNGATPNGTNGYADTKLNISSEFTSQTQSFSFYTPVSNSTSNVLGGVTNGTSTIQFFNPIGQYNILGTAYVKSSAMSNGFILMSQPSSNNTSAYEKGVKLGTFSQAQSALINFNYYIAARNFSNTADSYANRQFSFAHIGNGLTDTEAANLYTRVQAFQTALNRQV